MNAQEKHNSDVATCRCCLLAETMRGCKACRFNVREEMGDCYICKLPVYADEADAVVFHLGYDPEPEVRHYRCGINSKLPKDTLSLDDFPTTRTEAAALMADYLDLKATEANARY